MGMDIHGKSGNYFRANIWAWRPIHALCEAMMERELPMWAYNDGDGLQTSAECQELADRLEAFLAAKQAQRFIIESDIRFDEKGRLLEEGNTGGESAFRVERGHLQEFVEFLRECGEGFEIH